MFLKQSTVQIYVETSIILAGQAKAFGIQIKPITAKANFGNYSVSERMKASFEEFTENFAGKVFIIFSLDGEIGNAEVLGQIEDEIKRLRTL